MKIISKHRDYYDGAMGYDSDPSLVYVREKIDSRTNIGFEDYYQGIPYEEYRNFIYVGENYIHEKGLIGFCGRVYPYLVFQVYKIEGVGEWITQVCFSEQDWSNNMHKIASKDYIDGYDKFRIGRKKFIFKKTETTKATIEEYFARHKDKFTNVFMDKKAAIWIHYKKCQNRNSGDNFQINCELTPYDFARIVNPFEAYQEISMYLGGVLGTGNPSVPEVSNNDLIEAKGFNLKTSFRKEKDKQK